ncbi:MAG TPA: hypothetical protein VL993_07880 [Stellaceae bacterium]|nr:hypothetical protein [Stellaceae bacterium]
MSSLADTIAQSMQRLGPATKDKIEDIFAGLDSLDLAPADLLSVLATSLAAMAATHHARHMPVYFEAVRTWSLEISAGLSPAPALSAAYARGSVVADGAEIILAGLDGLFDELKSDRVGLQDRLVLELALFAQLLGQHDANAILMTLRTVADALSEEDYRPGRAILVPLGQLCVPLGRDACLAELAPRGMA